MKKRLKSDQQVFFKEETKSVAELIIANLDNIKELQRDEDYTRHLATIVEFSDDAIISKSLDGTIKSWNKGSEKMFNYTSEQAVGKHISLIIPPEYVHEEKEILNKIRNNEVIDHYETVRYKKDGELVYVSLSVSPLKDLQGNIIGVSKIAHDITFRKKSEAELTRATKEFILQNKEKEKRAAELIIANKELIFQNEEKEKRAAELAIANKELVFQNQEKEKRAAELIIANKELIFQNEEKEKRAAELAIANKELVFQNQEKEKRAAELIIANKELIFQSEEKEKRAIELAIANRELDKATLLSRIGSYDSNLINNVLFWSPMVKEIHEVGDDFIPEVQTAIAFYKEGQSRESMTKAYYDLVEKNIPFDLELQIVTAKGNECWVRAIGEAEWHSGVCTRMYGSFQDIDKIKKAEFEVFKAYEEKNIILESIGDAFFAVDLNWVVTYWNKEAEKLLECARNKIIGKNIWEIFEETDNTSFYSYYHKALQKHTIEHFEAYYEKTASWFDVTAYPSLNGLSVYIKDVTERKSADIRLIELNRDLQKYTRELVISNTELEQFSYIISHNLRGPVANIMGLTEELKDESHTDETKEILNTSLLSCVQILNDVTMDLNSILSAKMEISERKEFVSLSDLVTDIELDIRKEIQIENVQIRKEFNEIDQILTLKSYIYSIFFNLITNSIKYRQYDISPIIDIKSEISDKQITIIFADNGMGIDMSRRKDQVFGLYKRFHHHVEGKGIGLFMVKTQVETLGGRISIKSDVNMGTEFKITFPLEQ